MKERVIIKKDNTILYEGSALNMPIKEEYVTKLSIEIFDDDDPCIIHQSYVIKELVSKFLEVFESQNSKVLNAVDFTDEFDFLNFDDIASLTLEIVVK